MSDDHGFSMVPPDFPRGEGMASIAGVQPKVAVRIIDGQYIAGWTPEELQERYESCEDLARQLAAYCTRKAAENPAWTSDYNLQRTARGMSEHARVGRWDVTVAEQEWIMQRVRLLLDW